jgi:hypothetical protein
MFTLTDKTFKFIIDKINKLSLTQIPNIIRISKRSTHTILKNHMKVRRVPHLQTYDQKERVICAEKLLKMFLKYDSCRFLYIVIGDEG